jgi:hypothetical protein
MKTPTRPLKHSMKRAFCLFVLLVISFVLPFLGLAPVVRAVDPPPDGGYPGNNTAEGTDALFSVTPGQFSGTNNTALGFDALFHTTIGVGNTAVGSGALFFNTIGDNNTGVGVEALENNTSSSDANTAIGYRALKNNTNCCNTAIGNRALLKNTTGSSNIAIGFDALVNNTIGYDNTATGSSALGINGIGIENTANGAAALSDNTTGNDNTAIGNRALEFNTTGNNNIAIGASAGKNLTTGDNNIDIGGPAMAGESNTIRIGSPQGVQTATFVEGISGTAVTGTPVVVSGNGQLGVAASSERFKQNIQPMARSSEALLGLQPVTFHYKKQLDPKGIPQFGLVAEDVEKVNPDLIVRDKEGKPYSVRYEAVNAMLLNEFLKEHQTVQQLKKQIAELTAGLQKVSAQLATGRVRPIGGLEASKTTSHIALNNP